MTLQMTCMSRGSHGKTQL